MDTFDRMPLLVAVKEALHLLSFTKPTEIQSKIIPLLLADFKRDVHAQAQTGTGKTLAFGIPLLHAIDQSNKSVQGLIIAPTRELVLQIYENLKDVARGTKIAIEPIYGGMPINRQIDAIQKGVQIIIGTPGRINDHLRRKTLHLKNLKVLILDEADIMLDMGFRKEIDAILDHMPKSRNIWLFSATIMSGVQKLIKSHMQDVVVVKAAPKEEGSPRVKQYYCIVPLKKRIEATTRFIKAAPDFYGIIFGRTKVLVSEITEELASKGFKVNCLHGDMKQTLRNHVIKGFKNKDFTILVATDVAARGIDVSDLTHVINYSMPDDVEGYIHRIGRTGRAGKEGIAIVFASPADLYRVKRFEKATNGRLLEIPIPSVDTIINAKMSAVSDFIEQAKKVEVKPAAVDTALKKMVDSFTDQEVRDAFILALKEKFFRGISEKDDMSFSDGVLVPQEICMELGIHNGVTEEQIRSYLYTTCKLLPQEISKVRVLKNKTFISIPENRLNSCVAAMRKHSIITRKYKIYLVKDHYQKEGSYRKQRTKNRKRIYPGKRR